MATSPKKETPDSGVLQDQPTAAAAQHGDHDRIVMASRRPDGSMDQIAPEFIGDKETTLAAAREQLAVQAASAVDVAARGVSSGPAGDGAGDSEPDADVKALKDAQDKAVEQAAARAEREVEELHKGLGD
ncbi:hypothetical protein OG481_09790 [Streptomyces longwoodensis]|uniref:hypothetical protein n=1 Tax=Streptomyces longwoodensis TaxID=68231 RepID=UPI002DD8360A|nr:hypothetical protein [Streptomyces longwoodensis]WRY88808.1 hypothetical protein OG481_09790 [Streptomyces longwoodensis]